MKIPPTYLITPQMIEYVAKIDSIRLYVASFNLQRQVKEEIQRTSILKSSLFSARIEGNTLEFDEIQQKVKSEEKREVFNIVKAIRFVDSHVTKGPLLRNQLLRIHSLVLEGMSTDGGILRKEVSAIFNQAGVAVYMPPPPLSISKLLNDLLSYINSRREKFPLIAAFIAHLIFEKIHPFLDGNGRVGRILISAILKARGWDFTFAVPFEEYLDEYKDEYYFYLDVGLQETNDYLLFMLEAFLWQAENIKKQVDEAVQKKDELFLPPRQEEIYNIIRDHKVVYFDIIKRRFRNVAERTLRYDLKKLLDKGLIEKSGETRGRYYRVKN